MLVRERLPGLRVFVALALPTLVWCVFALVRDSVSDEQLVDAVFGAFVGLLVRGDPGTTFRGLARHPLTSPPHRTRHELVPPLGNHLPPRAVRTRWARSVRGKG